MRTLLLTASHRLLCLLCRVLGCPVSRLEAFETDLVRIAWCPCCLSLSVRAKRGELDIIFFAPRVARGPLSGCYLGPPTCVLVRELSEEKSA